MSFKLSARSESRLVGVHPDLVRIVRKALEISPVDFSVAEGLRTLERQRELVSTGKSRIMNSRHLTGHAVDLYPVSKAGAEWVWADFVQLVDAMKNAAQALGLPLQCGHDWKSFPDSPHHQLPSLAYPA